jgi:beta-N-acetylhexosaminidase
VHRRPRSRRSIHPRSLASIVWHPIPFGRQRRQQMGAYSRRHYREWTWRLTDPHVIVEHYTDGTSSSGAWATFAANGVHLGELPGVCAHFVIDTDGTIYQLVSLRVRCRHAIGMNSTAIGIEHVVTSDQQILSNLAMMRSRPADALAHDRWYPRAERDRPRRDL